MGWIQKSLRRSVHWLLFWLFCVLAFIIPGILFNISSLLWATLGFVYPIVSTLQHIMAKLVRLKKSDECTIPVAASESVPNREDIESMYPAVNGVRVMPIQERHLSGALAVYNKFVGSGQKRLCCLIPLSLFPTSMDEFRLYFATENARSASAVAIRVKEDDATEEEVVGFVHMVDASMDRDPFSQWMHALEEGECYIETMCVASEMRGRGIGLRLLEFCEARARERNARVLTLGVVANNPAKRLYKRFGFVDRKHNAISYCKTLLVVFCVMGSPHCGVGGSVMEKDLSLLTPTV
ncbi:hypothetical protein ACHAW6_000872 [Cyclotella cf. meneghiniana]